MKRKDRKTGHRTLLTSVLLSAPGPLVLGAALLMGRSSTQLADFIRRTAELGAIIVSWMVYRSLYRNGEPAAVRRLKLERIAALSVGTAMVLSGSTLLVMAVFLPAERTGSVVPALIIAALGAVVNAVFWLRYRHLDSRQSEAIMAGQSRLYLAKTLVDLVVSAVLLCVALAPGQALTRYVDLCGSAVISLYLIINGLTAIRDSSREAAEAA